MVQEFRSGQIAEKLKANQKRTYLIKSNMRVNGKTINRKVRASFMVQKEKLTKAIGKTIRNMARENSHSKMEPFMMATGKMINTVERAYYS